MRVGIVGCGIAGAYLAWKLSKDNDVMVFEKKKAIGKEVCSGLVSERLWDFIPKNEKLIENKIEEVRIHFKKKTVYLKLKPTMFVLNHKLLDQYVAGLAKKSGARIFTRTKVLGMKEQEKVYLKTNKGVFEFDRVIGCDGPLSKTREFMKVKQPKFVLGIQIFENNKNHKGFVDVWPTKNGFLWKIPRGKSVEYGIIEDMKYIKALFHSFLKERKIKNKKFLSAIIPSNITASVAKSRIALCGDSAGFTKPWSRGGIIWSLVGANVLLESFPDFEKYDKQIKKKFIKKIFFSKLTKEIGVFIANKTKLIPEKYVFDSDWVF